MRDTNVATHQENPNSLRDTNVANHQENPSYVTNHQERSRQYAR